MCGPETNRESLFLLWRVCPVSCWRSREGVKWEKDLSNRPAFGDNSHQGLSLALEDPPSPSDQGLNQDGIYQSCPERGTEAHLAGTSKLTDEDPDCGGVDMLREQTGIGKHPGTSMLKSLYHWGLSNSISKGEWEPELCRGSIHRSWGLGRKQPLPRPWPGESRGGSNPIFPSAVLWSPSTACQWPCWARSQRTGKPGCCNPQRSLYTLCGHTEEQEERRWTVDEVEGGQVENHLAFYSGLLAPCSAAHREASLAWLGTKRTTWSWFSEFPIPRGFVSPCSIPSVSTPFLFRAMT